MVRGAFRVHGRSLPMKDVQWEFDKQLGIEPTEFWAAFDYNFWLNLDPLTDGTELLGLVEGLVGVEQVGLLSSPCDTVGCREGKQQWVNKHLPQYRKRLFLGSAKELFAGPTKILIDDNKGNIDRFVAAGGIGLLIPRPWNCRKGEIADDSSFDVDTVFCEAQTALEEARGNCWPFTSEPAPAEPLQRKVPDSRLTILEQRRRVTSREPLRTKRTYLCQCTCGNIKEVEARGADRGSIKSCGCLRSEVSSKRARRHGESHTRLHNVWCGIIARCYYPHTTGFHRYGGRGIKVCKEWHNYEAFRDWAIAAGYDEGLQIDRYPNKNGSYEPANCRWTTPKKNSNNRRSNLLVEYQGKTQTLAEWCDELGLSYGRTQYRLHAGWSLTEVFSKDNVRPWQRASKLPSVGSNDSN